MAAQVCNNRPKVMDDDDDEDDVPIVFRRSGGAAASSRPGQRGQANPAPKKLMSPPSHVSRNAEGGTGPQKSRPLPAAKVVKEGSSSAPAPVSARKLDKPKAPAESSRAGVADSDESDDDKPLSMRFSAASPSEKTKSPVRPIGNPGGEDDTDSDDDKPLSFRKSSSASGGQKKNEPLQPKKEISSPRPSSVLSQKMPSSNLHLKPASGSSIKKSYDSDEEKPLGAKYPQNGFHKESGLASKSSKEPSKRPLAVISDSVQSSSKKMKVSDDSGTLKVKQETIVKKEMKTHDDDDDDYVPISQRTKKPASSSIQSPTKKVLKKVTSTTSFKKDNKNLKKETKNSKFSGGGRKWTTLEHNGVIFPPPYKPHHVKMLYNGQPVDLTPEQEEVATMFAVMKDTDYATKPTFIENFFNDWKPILGRNHVIKKFELCDFTPIYEWHLAEKEKKKQMSSEEKKTVKEEKLKQEEKYMWAVVDGVKEKVGNFRVEPPGLFRGRGEHPKMGKLKKRILPRDITINMGKSAPIPECPIPGERWKEVKHDNTVTWLAYWNDPINPKETKYVFLAASSSLKGQSDKQKYEKARKLKDYIHAIRSNYTRDFTSKDEIKRQIAVATYLIDKLALRAGNEKDEDEADTVGCCTLKIENVKLIPPDKLEFDFLGKDSVRFFNTVEVLLPVFKAVGDFRKGKKKGEDLFDKLDTSKLNAHLKELMPGLTAKVFRTYNASFTLDKMLTTETEDGSILEKVAIYQKANKEVAIICNHQRSIPKGHDNGIFKIDETISKLEAQKEKLEEDLNRAKKGKSASGNPLEKIRKQIAQLEENIRKNEVKKAIKNELKTVALGTSKINYCDPRISVSWCKRHEVPIEKVFTKTLCEKFAWAMDVDPSFRF